MNKEQGVEPPKEPNTDTIFGMDWSCALRDFDIRVNTKNN